MENAVVYHLIKFEQYLVGLTPMVFPRDFVQVATVESNDPEDIYRLTNSICAPWWNNDKVTGQPARSTSPGDVIVIGNTLFHVCNIGFKEYPLAEEVSLVRDWF